MKLSQQTAQRKFVSYTRKNPVYTWVACLVLLASLICAAITFYVWSSMIVTERNHQIAVFTQQHLDKAVSEINSHMLSLTKRVAFYGQSSQLITALEKQNQLLLRPIRRNIINNNPQAEGVRLIAKGTATLNLDAELPLRFSELEMIKLTEQRQPVTPEAVNLAKGWRLSFAIPIPTDIEKPVVGTLLVTMTMDSLYEAMGKGLNNLGKLTFIQSFQGGEHRLHSIGNGGYLPTKSLNVRGTPWKVEFSPSKNILSLVQTNWLIFLLTTGISWIAGLTLAIVIGLYVGRRGERERIAIEKTRQRMGQSKEAGSNAALGDLSADILDIQVNEDDDLLGLGEEDEQETQADHEAEDIPDAPINQVPAPIFRAYDIRGIVETDITKETAQLIGQAIGSEALDLGEEAIIVGRDARTHSPLLTEYLVRGILSTGCHVINIGTVPSPVVYFATETLEGSKSGVVVTASHNGAEYNGFKVVMQGRARTEEDIQVIRQRIEQNKFYSGAGEERHHDVNGDYIDTIFADVALAGEVSIVIDGSNGVAGAIAPKLFGELGCSVTAINCDLDGTFPNHGPDPTRKENLTQLIDKVTEVGADFGVAFDGDGDRLVIITSSGQIIWPDRLLMLFAKDILSRNPGADVVYDVKCTRNINKVVTRFGGRPIMWKTGHSPMKAKIAETGALLGGEYAGHIFIKERWFGFDDGIYVAARLAEILSLAGESLDTLFEEFPELPHTNEILVSASDDKKFNIIETLIADGDFKDAKFTTLDGLRIDFPFGWGIVRASNTSANITLRAEAQSDEELHDIKALLTRELRKIDPALTPKW